MAATLTSTVDYRHFQRLFGRNPHMQEKFVIELLSTRSYFKDAEGRHREDSTENIEAIEKLIVAFFSIHNDWFEPAARAHAEVLDIVRERQPELLTT